MGRYPWVEVLLFEVLHIIIFYPTHQNAYRAVVLAAMIYVASQIFSTPETTDPVNVAYCVGNAIASRFIYTAYVFFAEGSFPDDWRRIRDEVHTGPDTGDSKRLPSDFPFTKKFWWMIDIAYSQRMIGWVQEPRKGIPPHPPPSRQTFLWKTFLKFILNTIITDFTVSAYALDPAFDHRLHDPTDGPETYLAAVPLLRRVPYVLAYMIGLGIWMCSIHSVVALVCVGLGNSNPTLWPDLFGHWRDAYTLRKLWGQTWHQHLRPMFSGLGRLVANKILKFPRGSNRSSYTQLYVAFFLSGLLHLGGDFVVERRVVYHSFKFFLLQAVAITFEDLVIYIAKRSLRWRGFEFKPGRVDESWVETAVRITGYCWVTLWFCYTLPVWIDDLDVFGFSSNDRRPITQFLLDIWKRWA